MTLPLIYLLEKEPEMRASVQAVMSDGHYGQVSRKVVLDALERSGVLERARKQAREYAKAAQPSIEGLPGSPYLEALRTIPAYIVERER